MSGQVRCQMQWYVSMHGDLVELFDRTIPNVADRSRL